MFERQLIYKVYGEDGTYIGVIDDVTSNLSISKEINGGDSEFRFSLSRKFDDFDEDVTIKFNNRVKVFLKDDYNPAGDKLVAFGYIVSYSPFLQGKIEGLEVTCLSAVSKLSNDFFRSGDAAAASELGVELTTRRADQMMEDVVDHYISVESNSMISGSFANCDITTDNDGNIISFTHRFFNMKHLDALREASKFLPKNKSGGYWFYWRIDTDGKLWVKNISATADHSFIIGKHIKAISGEKSMMDVVNKVYFWNEKGTVDPDFIKLVNSDTDSQDDHDVMAEYLTDSKITNTTAASLLTSSKLQDGKDPKVTIQITLTGNYDLASIKPGHTCKLLNAKNNPYKIGSDNVLLIESIRYDVDEATLQLSNGHVSFSDMIEEERQRLDKEMTWFGFITQQLTAAQLSPANRVWSTDIVFSATSGANAYRQVDWTAGIIYLPAGESGASGRRVIFAGNTGLMSASTDYYIYLDEETFNTSASNADSGTGSISKGGDSLLDASKAWTVDQFKGHISTIGGQTRIVRSNTATVLTLEESWSVANQTGAYTIKKMSFDVTTDKSAIADVTKILFTNVKANALTTSEAIIVPVRDQNINIDGTQIAKKSISADNIIANTITASEIYSGYIYSNTIEAVQITAGTLTGFEIQTSASGLRLKMSGSADAFQFLNGSTVLAELVSATVPYSGLSGAILQHGTGTVGLEVSGQGEGLGSRQVVMTNSDGSRYFGFFDLDDGTFSVFSEVHLMPGTTNSYDLGSSSLKWKEGHFQGALNAYGGLFADEIAARATNAVIFGDAMKLKQLTADPSSGAADADGVMYYDALNDLVRVKVAGTWKTVTVS